MSAQLPERADVVIAGLGTAGAAAALSCARAGLRVVAIDRAPLDRAGAHWLNAVPARSFDDAGIDRPRGAELVGDGVAFHMVVDRARTVVRDHGVLEVDMALLVERLQRGAREAGAMLRGETRALELRGDVLRTDAGAVRADAFVDATGLAGVRWLGEARVARVDLCSAAHEIRAVRDRGAAEAFFAGHGVALGETLSLAGLAGGYSVLNFRMDADGVAILAGSIPAQGHPSGRAMIERFASEHAWLGAPTRAASRAIPLGRPHDTIARGRVAAMGDAALQVFAAHGSGIGAGLVAARVLGDALARGRGPEDYGVRWQREHGGLFAGYDVFRRFAQRLTRADVARAIETGLFDAPSMLPAMRQERPDVRSLGLGKVRSALRAPRLVAQIAKVMARMGALEALYAAYPSREIRRREWSRAVALITGSGSRTAA